MHPADRNNPCGTEKQDRDASDRGKVIPVVKKRKTGMHSVGRNNPCGAKERNRAELRGGGQRHSFRPLVEHGSGEGVGSAVLSREDLMEILGGES